MGVQDIVRLVLPKEDKFFEYLERQARLAHEGAQLFARLQKGAIAQVKEEIHAITGTAVAKTIASGFAAPGDVTQAVVLATLIGASAWNLITWWYGIASSSSHALIGGLAGAVAAHAGLSHFNCGTLVKKVLVPLVVSPLFGFVLAFVVMTATLWIIKWIKFRPGSVNRGSRILQLYSASAMALAHGSNDAQKSMGIMTLAITSYVAARGAGALPAWVTGDKPLFGWVDGGPASVPEWVVLACALAIGLGTMAGGKRIIKTMGTKLIKITLRQGFAAETSGASTIPATAAIAAVSMFVLGLFFH